MIFLKDLSINTVFKNSKKPWYNDPVGRMYQGIHNIHFTKYLSNRVFNYIYRWVKFALSISWEIRSSDHLSLNTTPVQASLGIDMIFKLIPIIYWRVIASRKKQKYNIGNYHKYASGVRCGYSAGYLLYVLKDWHILQDRLK